MLATMLAFAPGCKDKSKDANKSADDPPSADLTALSGASSLPVSGSGMAGHEDEAPEIPVAECEVAVTDVDRVLDQAAASYEEGKYAEAYACSQVAVDLVPQAVEAQHVRAAALAALGRYDDAQVGFAMALALDPDDPETLAAAAEFYINMMPSKRRSTLHVGLEYARRGSERAATRRRLDRSLRGRLLLLEAEALNDLGHPDEALPRVDEALQWAPGLVEAIHERGVSLFNLCRFDEAELAFLDVLSLQPDDPYAHHHLGLIYERFAREADADAHFERARELSPSEFMPPVILSPKAFRAEVDEAISELDKDLRGLLSEIELELVDLPTIHDLAAAEPPFSPTILGLYRGLPLGVEEGDRESAADTHGHSHSDALLTVDGEVPPRAIVLYRKNLGRAARSRDELDRQIRRTLLHEIGHLQGYDEDELRRRGLE